MSAGTRLDKKIAELHGCSRADARKLVEGGWVKVDGQVVEANQTLITTQVLDIDPQATLDSPEPATLLVHKPAGLRNEDLAHTLTPATRCSSDSTGQRILRRHFHRLSSLLPLDEPESGLVVFTQDGRVWRRLTEDVAEIEQEFVVEVSGEMAADGLARLARGLDYRGGALPPCKASWQNEFRLRMALKDVQPGQLDYMCRQVGLQLLSARRLRIGRISLSGLKPGCWRHLPVSERF